MKKKRRRKFGSIKKELIKKSMESMLSAIQIFNNPLIEFKSESFIVLAIIAWTYLLHAYYRSQNIEYRYYEQNGTRKKFDKTKKGAYKHWELERCLNDSNCPIDKVTTLNLRFLIGIRHEIEHQMTNRIDEFLSARFQACCLNYKQYLNISFPGNKIDNNLKFSLQFSLLSHEQIEHLLDYKDIPSNVSSYIMEYDKNLSKDDFNDTRYSYRVFFVLKTANRKGQADKVIEFIRPDSNVAKNLNKEYVVFKDRERKKYLPSEIWKEMQKKGYRKFGQHQHTQLWKAENAKTLSKGYGVQIAKTWYWYESWFQFVNNHCKNNKSKYQ